jgi:Uracil-DNA glycosylase
MINDFRKLENLIVSCKKCPRLVRFRNKIAKDKRKQYINEEYWGKPITGFGDPKARILFVGLAPAAHGGNRTGRVFTGDRSSDFYIQMSLQSKVI